MPFTGARNVPELSGGPDYLQAGGIQKTLADRGVELKPLSTVRLLPEEEQDYGEWHRMGLANGHLADLVAENRREGFVSVGFLANCTSVVGVLGGLQHSGPGRRPLRVGLVFIDAHGDFNTPETTLSGMLGGMPVAISAGMALTNLRLKSGLEPALPTRYIVMAGVRDTDPLEQDLIDRSEVQLLTTEDIRGAGAAVRAQMERLSQLTDVIYVHVDMDVLDPREVAGHPLTVPDGPTSLELGRAIEVMFEYDKVAALGIASTPWGDRDRDGLSRQAAYKLIDGVLAGLAARREAGR
jgi:arginase